jgi:hypothetical protein
MKLAGIGAVLAITEDRDPHIHAHKHPRREASDKDPAVLVVLQHNGDWNSINGFGQLNIVSPRHWKGVEHPKLT